MPWAYAPEWLELSLGCDSQNLQLGLFASSSPNLSPREYFGSATGSPSGTISKPSTHDPGSGWSSLSPQGSHVNPSPRMASESGRPIIDGSGNGSQRSFASFDPDSCSWKTSPGSCLEGQDLFCATWPAWGSLQNGGCFHADPWEHPTCESGGSVWPTILSRDGISGCHRTEEVESRQGGPSLREKVYFFGLRAQKDGICPPPSGRLNPAWAEWLMGFPQGWIRPGETPRTMPWETQSRLLLQQWLGEFCPADYERKKARRAR